MSDSIALQECMARAAAGHRLDVLVYNAGTTSVQQTEGMQIVNIWSSYVSGRLQLACEIQVPPRVIPTFARTDPAGYARQRRDGSSHPCVGFKEVSPRALLALRQRLDEEELIPLSRDPLSSGRWPGALLDDRDAHLGA